MSSVFQEILIVFLLIVANGVFAMSEIAILSARKVRLQQSANRGNKKAKVALELANSPNSLLSTVQVGITLIGILAGAFGGAAISARLAIQLNKIPILVPHSNAISFTIVVIIITYLSLIIGELVPKRLALNAPESIATSVSIPMRWLSNFSSPVVHLLSVSTELILRLLGSHASTEPEVTEEEIKIMIEQGMRSGIVEEAEQSIVGRVFELGDRQVRSLMTPRPEIFWIDIDDSAEENRQSIAQNGYTRILICQEDLDHVLGFIKVSDLLTQSLSGNPLDLTTSLRRPLFIPETTSVLKILELFKQGETHFAVVVDEYGVIQGLVTLNDILMELVGDMPSWDNPEEPQKVQREDGSWLVDGMLPVEELFELFDLEDLLEQSEGNYHTVGGFVITQLGRIPAAADHFEWQNLRIEVMDMDGNRVDKVLIVPPSINKNNELIEP